LDNLAYIETYFSGELSEEKIREFERKIIAEPDFAEQVSFYLTSKQLAAAELKVERERFREVYEKYKLGNKGSGNQQSIVRKLWRWAAAAAVLAGIIFGINIWFKPISPAKLADKFIKENFQTLPIKMSAREDSLQIAIQLYNEGKLAEAQRRFESLAQTDTSFGEAKKYAGIVSLRLEQYDKAIDHFSQMEKAHLYANPGKFYQALTLLKRNLPGDREKAKQLLQQVVENDLEGKEQAMQWLRKW
jgi:tetratricopeptide (TPR) repeat protein